jgi:CheY-like chemotaxis protein
MVRGCPLPKALNRNLVLVVDDQPEVCRITSAVLSKAGFSIQVASDGQEGLECFVKHQNEICLVLSDVVMPRMNGLRMVDRIMEIEPNAKFLMMSAYSSAVLEIEARERLPFIRKPFLPRALIEKVDEVLGHVPG